MRLRNRYPVVFIVIPSVPRDGAIWRAFRERLSTDTTAPENVGEAFCAACEWGRGIAEKIEIRKNRTGGSVS